MKNKIHLFNQVHNPFFFLEMNALKKTKETINNKYNLSKMIKEMRSIYYCFPLNNFFLKRVSQFMAFVLNDSFL